MSARGRRALTARRDAWAVTTHRITYEGPSSLAVPTATMLADAVGVDLRSSEPPASKDGPWDKVVLVLTVEGTPDAVDSAVGNLRASLPAGASITVGPPG